MSEWKEYKLVEIADIVSGGTPSTKVDEYFGGDISWITPKDLTNHDETYIASGSRSITQLGLEKSSAKLVPENTILFTSRAPIGYIAIAANKVATNQGFKNIVVNKEIADYKYIYYLLKTITPRIKSMGTGTTFAEVSATVMKNLKISLPNLPTQQAIAEILTSLDDKIEINNKINQELEHLAQTIFKQWFVDFEFPDENSRPYRSSGGKMIESELGLIPDGWEVKKLSDVLDIKYGKDHKKLEDGPYPVYGSGGIMRYVEDYLYDQDSILIPRKGTLSNLFYVTEPFWSVDTMFYSKIYDESLRKYLFYFIKSKNIESMNVGSAVPSMTTKILNAIELAMPNSRILEIYETKISSFYEMIFSNRKETKSLAFTRDTLLPRLMKGEIEVPLGMD